MRILRHRRRASLSFHNPADTSATTGPEALEPVVRGFAQAIATIVERVTRRFRQAHQSRDVDGKAPVQLRHPEVRANGSREARPMTGSASLEG